MRHILKSIIFFSLLTSCSKNGGITPFIYDNSEIAIATPEGFPDLNSMVRKNLPTVYGVQLGKKLFREKKLSYNNTISCASCHEQEHAYSDANAQAVGIYGRTALRNAPALQNLAFLKYYNWDGSKLQLEKQPIVPIITHEEMNSSILEVIGKLEKEAAYRVMFTKAFGDDRITADRIYKSIAQYEYTLVSANSKYDRVVRDGIDRFTSSEENGYQVFKIKCENCHGTELFTDQSFKNVGFPVNNNIEEAGRAKVTGESGDYMSFRVPSLRNAEYTAPYGSFGQFATLKSVLDYFSNGVLASDNLDPILKAQGNRIPLTEKEKHDLISFIKTLSDKSFVGG